MLIAGRTFEFSDGKIRHAVEVRIFKPERVDDHEWKCEYEIGWPDATRRFAGHGIDSVQALNIALQMVGTEIYTSTYHRAGKLHYHKLPGGYGFPVAANCRDLLEGDDKEFF